MGTFEMTLTSDQIDDKIAGIDARLAGFKREAEPLSLASVNGDSAATARLQEIRTQEAEAASEKATLESALAEANRIEQAALTAEIAADRAAAVEEGRRQYQKMLDLATKVDVLCGDFRRLSDEIQAVEQRLKASARSAKLPDDGRIGQTGLAVIAKGNLDNCFAIGGHVSRPLREVAGMAWQQFAPALPETEGA